jgi:hypothetical protein
VLCRRGGAAAGGGGCFFFSFVFEKTFAES